MNKLREFKFNKIYELADLIDNSVKSEVEFWNYNEEYFVEAATKFSRDSLLHQYIATTAINFYRRDIRKNPENYFDESVEEWYTQFESYGVNFERKTIDIDNEGWALEWFEKSIYSFQELFDKMANETFHLLFANRQFLLAFNKLASLTIKDISIPEKFLTKKGAIKRVSIPQWVKVAVFHRNKGRCVFCNTDLTGLINTLTNSNYDHIVPLDLYGTNDPSNIQLLCETCNKTKNNRDSSTSNKYIPWWTN